MNPNSEMLSLGQSFEHEVVFPQANVDAFVILSGDANAIHSDPQAAFQSPIGQIAIPGMLAVLAFSKVLGTLFPGHGTVYRSQNVKFRLPMFVAMRYVVNLRVVKLIPNHHAAVIETTLCRKEDGVPCITGEAFVLNLRRIGPTSLGS
jgi:3-hydroxybutyryl-CoA dehydratase